MKITFFSKIEASVPANFKENALLAFAIIKKHVFLVQYFFYVQHMLYLWKTPAKFNKHCGIPLPPYIEFPFNFCLAGIFHYICRWILLDSEKRKLNANSKRELLTYYIHLNNLYDIPTYFCTRASWLVDLHIWSRQLKAFFFNLDIAFNTNTLRCFQNYRLLKIAQFESKQKLL